MGKAPGNELVIRDGFVSILCYHAPSVCVCREIVDYTGDVGQRMHNEDGKCTLDWGMGWGEVKQSQSYDMGTNGIR